MSDQSPMSRVPEEFPGRGTYRCKGVEQVVSKAHGKHPVDGSGRCTPVALDHNVPAHREFAGGASSLYDSLHSICTEFGIDQACQRAQETGRWPADLVPTAAARRAMGHLSSWAEATMGSKVDTSVPEGQPFRLPLLLALATCADDEDIAAIEHAIAGVPIGPGNMLEPSGLWPLRESHSAEFEPDREFHLRGSNCRSMDGPLFPDAVKALQKDMDDGFTVAAPPSEVHRLVAQDVLAFVDEGERVCADGVTEKKVRAVWDGTMVGPNPTIRIFEQQEMPTITDLEAVLAYMRERSVSVPGIKIDFKTAFKRVRVRSQDSWKLGFKVGDQWRRYVVLPFGLRTSGWRWGRVIGVPHRFMRRLFAKVLHGGMIYVDDQLWIVPDSCRWHICSIALLLLTAVGAPISWEKCHVGSQFDWNGYDVCTNSHRVGLTAKKQQKFSQDLQVAFEAASSERIPFLTFRRLSARMTWWSVACPVIRPFLRVAQYHEARAGRLGLESLRSAGLLDQHGVARPGASAGLQLAKGGWWVPFSKVKADLEVWHVLITKRPTWRPRSLTDGPMGISLRTDAMGDREWAGLGGFLAPQPFSPTEFPDPRMLWWFRLGWHRSAPPLPVFNKEPRHLIAALEALSILCALKVHQQMADGNSNIIIGVGTDSMVCQMAAGTWRTGSPVLNFVFREIALLPMLHDIHIAPRFIFGKESTVADALSRFMRHEKGSWALHHMDPAREIVMDVSATSFWSQLNDQWGSMLEGGR